MGTSISRSGQTPQQPTAAQKAKFQTAVQAYMQAHPGVSEADAKAAVKSEHQAAQQPQQQAAPTQTQTSTNAPSAFTP